MKVQGLECSSCGAPVMGVKDEAAYQCRFCGATINFHRALCPDCGLLNPEGQRFCTQCGATVVRTCPHCEHDSWAGAEYCGNCGRPLDLLEIMTQSRLRDTRARMEVQQQEAMLLKRRETTQAEARMEQFWEMERQRLEKIASDTAENRKRERQVVGILLLAAAFFVLLIIIIAVLWTMLGQ